MSSPSPASSVAAGFAGLGLADSLLASVAALGYEEATPVQRAAIPVLLAGRDVLGQAATGTGKTAAFALPMLHLLASSPAAATPRPAGRGAARPRTRGLVLVPTRELAMQVAEATHKYARGTGLAVVPVYGGASITQQVRALERGAAIVVATPGRALDLLKRGVLVLDGIELLVLDEADEMLDMGFAEELDALLEATPATRQTALFSATMPPRLRTIADRHLREPERISIAAEKATAGATPRVRQRVYMVPRAHKATALQRVLDMESPTSALVFCRTRLEVDDLVERLSAHGYRAEALHGGMAQRQREAVLGRLRSAKTDLLVATDVAARGLDIPQLSHVINYDVPVSPEAYIHRIGRTGRAGREGVAITLAEPREHRLLRSLEKAARAPIERATLPTLADLQARRLDRTRVAIHERLTQGDVEVMHGIVSTLAEEFDLMDVAAAAVALVHASLGGDSVKDEDVPVEIPVAMPPSGDHGGPERGRKGPRPGAGAGPGVSPGMARLFIGAGRRAGIRPADLVGAIANEAGLKSRDIGGIQLADAFSLVEVPEEMADTVITALRGTTLRGERVTVRRDRDTGPTEPRPRPTAREGRGASSPARMRKRPR